MIDAWHSPTAVFQLAPGITSNRKKNILDTVNFMVEYVAITLDDWKDWKRFPIHHMRDVSERSLESIIAAARACAQTHARFND